MSLLFDFFVIAVFAISLFLGIKRGFIRSVMGIAVLVVAVFGSMHFSDRLATHLKERYVEEAVSNQVSDAMSSLMSGVESLDLDKLFEEKPQAFMDILDRFDVDFEELKQYYDGNAAKTEDPLRHLAAHIAEPLADTLSKAAAFAILFLGILVLLSLALLILDLVFKLPFLNGANKLLGAIFGAVMGLAFAWGISTVLCALLPHLSMLSDGALSSTVIEDTIVVRFLASIDILSLF